VPRPGELSTRSWPSRTARRPLGRFDDAVARGARRQHRPSVVELEHRQSTAGPEQGDEVVEDALEVVVAQVHEHALGADGVAGRLRERAQGRGTPRAGRA
jgi:hypothetical protein